MPAAGSTSTISKRALQVRRVVAAAAAQLQDRTRWTRARGRKSLRVKAGLLLVLGRRGEQRPPRRELVVHLGMF
jgi:hypothetical protein